MSSAAAVRSVGPEMLQKEEKGVKMLVCAVGRSVLCKFGSFMCGWEKSFLITLDDLLGGGCIRWRIMWNSPVTVRCIE